MIDAAMLSTLSPEIQAHIAALEAKASAKAKPTKLTLKVSEKGAVSIYGMGRFPVTLYKGQWDRLIEHIGEVKAFIAANESLLAVKA